MLMARNALICSKWLVTEPCVRSFMFAVGFHLCYRASMSVQVYGCNHIAIEVDDVGAAVKFFQDVFYLGEMEGGERDAFFKLGEDQFFALFEIGRVKAGGGRPFGLIVGHQKHVTDGRQK